MKGLIFEYIRDATGKAVSEFLSPDYGATCASTYAQRVRERPCVALKGVCVMPLTGSQRGGAATQTIALPVSANSR